MAGLYGAATLMFSGWPASIMLMSGSGPFGPSFLVVWQSWHPPPITSIFPRSAGDGAGAAAGAAGAGAEAGGALHAEIASAIGRLAASRATRYWKKRMNLSC